MSKRLGPISYQVTKVLASTYMLLLETKEMIMHPTPIWIGFISRIMLANFPQPILVCLDINLLGRCDKS